MTVPGKGGRPRKWRSDADRVRAYRARQRGDEEPPTMDVAPGADEGATVAWAQVRTLGETIAEQREELREVRTELRRAEKELDHERGAHLVLEGANTRLRTSVDTLTAENDELRRSIADLRSLLSEQRRPEPSARGPNRAHPHDRSHTRRDG